MPCTRASLSIGALFGEPGGGLFSRILREINSISEYLFFGPGGYSLSEALVSLRHIYPGSFFLNTEDIRKLNIGAI